MELTAGQDSAAFYIDVAPLSMYAFAKFAGKRTACLLSGHF